VESQLGVVCSIDVGHREVGDAVAHHIVDDGRATPEVRQVPCEQQGGRHGARRTVVRFTEGDRSRRQEAAGARHGGGEALPGRAPRATTADEHRALKADLTPLLCETLGRPPHHGPSGVGSVDDDVRLGVLATSRLVAQPRVVVRRGGPAPDDERRRPAGVRLHLRQQERGCICGSSLEVDHQHVGGEVPRRCRNE
jgi:hypothetical protein